MGYIGQIIIAFLATQHYISFGKDADEFSVETPDESLGKGMVNHMSGIFEQRHKAISLPVAFSAHLGETSHFVRPNDTLVFDVELTNDGDGYDKTTGVFTVPIGGVYVFNYFLLGRYDGDSTVALTVDGKIKSVASSRHAHIGGNVVVLSAHKGEKVRIQANHMSLIIVSDPFWGYTSFSGFLLYVI